MSWHEVMTWRQWVTSWHEMTSSPVKYLPVYLEFYSSFLREPTLITKTLKWFQAKQWRHDISITSCHDVLNTDYFTTLLSPEVDMIEQRFFLIFKVFGSRKSIACRQDTWSWCVTLYIKVMWPYNLQVTYLISGPIHARDMFLLLFPWFLGSRKSMACRPDTWPWHVTLYVKVMQPFKWPIFFWDLYMLETWIFFVSMVSWVKEVNDM